MGRILIGLLILTLSTAYSSAYHQYHHFKPRDLYDEYNYHVGKAHSAEDTVYEVDQPDVHEELNVPDSVYDGPNYEAADLNEIPDDARANVPINGYEVTEDVDDIPNPVEFRPIVANYTKVKPLNLARPNDTHSTIVEREIDDKNGNVFNKVEHTHEDLYSFSEVFPKVKESFEGVKTSFVNDLNNIKDKVFKKLDQPVSYLNKLHAKANGVLDDIKRFFGYDIDNEEDFETF